MINDRITRNFINALRHEAALFYSSVNYAGNSALTGTVYFQRGKSAGSTSSYEKYSFVNLTEPAC
jgi:hypothetical protein